MKITLKELKQLISEQIKVVLYEQTGTPLPVNSSGAVGLEITTGGTPIQWNPPAVTDVRGRMYQLTLAHSGINGANFNQVLAAIRPYIVNACTNSFNGTDLSRITSISSGTNGTIVIRFPWADAQYANRAQKIREALQKAQSGTLSRLGRISFREITGDVSGTSSLTTASITPNTVSKITNIKK